VDGAGQQLVDLLGWQVDELLGQLEDVAHAHAEDHVSGALGTLAGVEVPPKLVALHRRATRFESCQERLGGGLRRHPEAAYPIG
jgi:hypothetical protein